ncbi:hypothetical protein F8S09_15525 [Deinococcus sp. SDU3-2]|uniref:Uncharacterized protein n=1 Tax=Deinococcus terrestris TaxID=2651870 RepID=A0A7X1TT29_9DEIO|nr:hypothetical protein [Deinococcus terrestris]MPY68066.1 hypothetical protein [Deinococcus terrestris]
MTGDLGEGVELEGEACPTPDRRDEFTVFTRSATFSLTGFERQRRITGFEAAACQPVGVLVAQRLHLTPPVVAQQTLRFQAERQQMRVAFHDGRLRIHAHPWTTPGMVRFLVRSLRRYGVLEEAELRTLYHQWRAPGTRLDFLDLHRYPEVFVQTPAGPWTLTTWVRLGTPYGVLPRDTGGWSREWYVHEAARFWLARGRTPTEAQEWDADVRALVAATLATPPLPRYFVPSSAGPFSRVTVRGREAYRLDLDHLPEGPYFTLRAGGVAVTYSVEGRAFLADTAGSVSVVTPFLTRRLLEALWLPAQDPSITWLSAGVAFKEALRRGGLSV